MQLESKAHISPLLAIECPVAQWLEHPTRSRRVVVSDFSEFPVGSSNISFQYWIDDINGALLEMDPFGMAQI